MQTVFSIRTTSPGLQEFTEDVARFVRDSGRREGLLTLFVPHASCSGRLSGQVWSGEADRRVSVRSARSRPSPHKESPAREFVSKPSCFRAAWDELTLRSR
jgi:hypothetical protein